MRIRRRHFYVAGFAFALFFYNSFCVVPMPRSRRAFLLFPTPKFRQSVAITHVIFTTTRKSPEPSDKEIFKKAQDSLKALSRSPLALATNTNIQLTFFNQAEIERGSVKTNRFGMPFIGALYNHTFNKFPNADTYTYVNGDILFDESFVLTANLIVNRVRKGEVMPRFLVIGQRCNVAYDFHSLNPFNGESHLNQGWKDCTLFGPDAEDYFIISRNTFNFNDEILSRLVVGRLAFDNVLVYFANLDANIQCIDATKTIRAYHLNAEGNNSLWRSHEIENLEDRNYVINLFQYGEPPQEKHSTEDAPWVTEFLNSSLKGENQVVLVKRQRPKWSAN